MAAKYIVLLSGGLDSVVNLHEAHASGTVLMALTFDYGQRAAKKEIVAAKYFCQKLNVPHQVIEIPWLKEITHTALVNTKNDLPHLRNLDDYEEGSKSALKVWVPNRNGIFLNVAAAFAESMGAEYVVPGFNREEAATFPDNSEKFIEASSAAFKLSTLSGVKVICFTTDLDKTEIVKKARSFSVEIQRLWSCYKGDLVPCGECESCQRTLRATHEI